MCAHDARRVRVCACGGGGGGTWTGETQAPPYVVNRLKQDPKNPTCKVSTIWYTFPMRRDGIPKSFQLAGHTIRVLTVAPRKWKHGKNNVGIWIPDSYTIELLSTLKGTNRQQIFMHEATHAILDIAGYYALSEDEALVDRLAHLLQQMLTTME